MEANARGALTGEHRYRVEKESKYCKEGTGFRTVFILRGRLKALCYILGFFKALALDSVCELVTLVKCTEVAKSKL